jgi:hypothetical protein
MKPFVPTVVVGVVLGALGFVAGRVSVARGSTACEERASKAEHERDELLHTKIELTQLVDRSARHLSPALDASTKAIEAHVEVVDAGENEVRVLSLQELTEMRTQRATDARKSFFSRADLTADQQTAVTRIVDELNQTLEAPVAKLEALDALEHAPMLDRIDAMASTLTAVKQSEAALRDLLSPQQRTALDESEVSISSQVGESSFWRLVTLGVVDLDLPEGASYEIDESVDSGER